MGDVTFQQLDFLYMPSWDVARDLAFYTEVFGAEIVFAIERFGTRVAEVRLAECGQRLAVYELTRPEVESRLNGRHDFGPAPA